MKNRSYYSYIVLIRNSLLTINIFGVLFCAGVQLLAVKYITDSGQSAQFIRSIQHIPRDPRFVFLGCLLALIVLGLVMMSRRTPYIEKEEKNLAGAILEIVCALIISILLNFSYPAIFLMIFCDCIFHLRRSMKGKWLSIVIAALYFFASYPLVDLVFPMMNLQKFFTVFPEPQSTALLMIKGIAETVNIVLSVSFVGVFLSWQIAENEDIAQELSMVSQVNRELKNYAAITEKIGEDKERKRLAREIHDTLGHALTGIAAGVDACIAMIDRNPQATKKQLQLVSGVVRQGISDVRSSLKKLRPGALEEQGLKGALKKMIDEFTSVSDVDITFMFDADQADFDVAKEDVLFRLIQESITNSIRHGLADYISISIGIDGDDLTVNIQDNGIGCSQISCGYGLLQMQERVLTVHGTVEFDGSSGFATHVRIPLQKGEKTE